MLDDMVAIIESRITLQPHVEKLISPKPLQTGLALLPPVKPWVWYVYWLFGMNGMSRNANGAILPP